MATALVTSPAGVKAIQKHEGLRLEAYTDAAGIPTIGYGHTGAKYAFPGSKITKQKALELLKQDLKNAEDIVNKWVKVDLTPPQFSALVSFVFNVGPGYPGPNGKDGFVWLKNGNHSTMLLKLNAGDYHGAANEFSRWTRAGGQVLNGLVARRAEERAMFISGIEEYTTEDRELESNIEPDIALKPPTKRNEAIAALGATGVAGTLGEASQSLAPLAEYSEYIRILWVIITIAAIGWFIYSREKD